MSTLYLYSTGPRAGKTALAVGLARRLSKDGYRVGYLKATSPQEPSGYADAELMGQLLALSEPREVLCPASAGDDGLLARIVQAHQRVTEGKDVVIAEGSSPGDDPLPPGQVVQELGASALLVARYGGETMVEAVLAAKRSLGDGLVGVVINAVPELQKRLVHQTLVPALEGRQLRVLGEVPQDGLLLAVSVGKLAQALGGQFLCGTEGDQELVESLMIGAISYEGALPYMGRKANKAVVTGGNRPDIQLAALQTPTRCLILTGGYDPDPTVVVQAEEMGVPLIKTGRDTVGALEAVQDLFGTAPMGPGAKVERVEGLLEGCFDFGGLYGLLHLSSPRPAEGAGQEV